MYYVLLVVIAVVLFLLRKRIFGGIVGVISLVLVIGLTIFLLDFFWTGTDFLGNERDVRDIEPTQEVVEQYDETVLDPVKKAQELGQSAKDKGIGVNETIQEAGSALDERLGIEKDGGNNNLWGADEQEEQDSGTSQEETNSEEDKEEGLLDKLISKGDNKGESEDENTNLEEYESKLTFDTLGKAESQWSLSTEDARFVRSASPFNLGEFSNGNITIQVVEDGVILK